jgi:hypothetical protein
MAGRSGSERPATSVVRAVSRPRGRSRHLQHRSGQRHPQAPCVDQRPAPAGPNGPELALHACGAVDAFPRNQFRSTSAMCWTRPVSVKPDGGTDAIAACLSSSPSHFKAKRRAVNVEPAFERAALVGVQRRQGSLGGVHQSIISEHPDKAVSLLICGTYRTVAAIHVVHPRRPHLRDWPRSHPPRGMAAVSGDAELRASPAAGWRSAVLHKQRRIHEYRHARPRHNCGHHDRLD